MKDFTINDIDLTENPPWIPNWFRAGFKSRDEAIEGIIKYMDERRGMFERLGLTGPIVKREKKGKGG